MNLPSTDSPFHSPFNLSPIQRVFFTLFPKITQVCVKVNCYTILCKIDEVFTQSNVGLLTFYTMLCKNVNLYIGLCND